MGEVTMAGRFAAVKKRYAYLLPTTLILAFYAAFFLYPTFQMVKISFHKSLLYGDYEKIFTLENYVKFFTDPFYLTVLGRSILLGIAVTVVTIPLGFILAYALWVSEGLKRKALYFCILFPLFTNLVIRLYGWRIIFSPTGPINVTLQYLGLINEPLKLIFTFPAVVIGLFSECTPYYVLIVFSVLSLVNRRYIDAAIDLGASRFRTFVEIIWPLTLPGVISGGFLTFIWSFGAFATPAILGAPVHWTAASHAERQILSIRDWPFGTAIGFLLLLFVLIFLYLQNRFVPKVRTYRTE
jgi:putative spermidine/putrescine transport system permease protein